MEKHRWNKAVAAKRNAVGKYDLRGKQGLLKDSDGNILLPVSEIKGYVNFKVPILYE